MVAPADSGGFDLKAALAPLGFIPYGKRYRRTAYTDGRTIVVDDRAFAGVFRVQPLNIGRDLFTAETPQEIVDLIRQAREMFS